MAQSPQSVPQGAQGTLTGPPTTVNLQQMADLVQAANSTVVALGALVQALAGAIGPRALSTPLQMASYTVAALPAVTLANVGAMAWAANALNVHDTTGAGTGCMVTVAKNGGTAVWWSVWSGLPPST